MSFPCGAQSLLGRSFLLGLVPAIQLAHDLRDVHGVGGFSGFGLFLLLPQDDGAGAGAEVAAAEQTRAGQREGKEGGLVRRRAPKPPLRGVKLSRRTNSATEMAKEMTLNSAG